jgi:hypothetical protein
MPQLNKGGIQYHKRPSLQTRGCLRLVRGKDHKKAITITAYSHMPSFIQRGKTIFSIIGIEIWST